MSYAMCDLQVFLYYFDLITIIIYNEINMTKFLLIDWAFNTERSIVPTVGEGNYGYGG